MNKPSLLFITALFVLGGCAAHGASPDVSSAPLSLTTSFEKARMEGLLARGDNNAIRETFRRGPGNALPFIDRYFEGGLKIIETGGSAAASRALESYRTGARFAKLADETFAETIFSGYATSFAGWSAPEQTKFREGQRLFREGAAATSKSPVEGLVLLRGSLQRAEELGDWWGQAMAHGGIAEAALAAGGDDDLRLALEAAGRASQLSARLRLRADYVEALLVSASVLEARAGHGELGPLREAWTVARDDETIPPELRTTARDRLVAALDRAGMHDEAAKIRR